MPASVRVHLALRSAIAKCVKPRLCPMSRSTYQVHTMDYSKPYYAQYQTTSPYYVSMFILCTVVHCQCTYYGTKCILCTILPPYYALMLMQQSILWTLSPYYGRNVHSMTHFNSLMNAVFLAKCA